MDVPGYVARYFPDETDDIILLTGKDEVVGGTLLEMVGIVKDIVAEVGEPIATASDVREIGEGEAYFSVSQYVRFIPTSRQRYLTSPRTLIGDARCIGDR